MEFDGKIYQSKVVKWNFKILINMEFEWKIYESKL